MTEHKSTFKSTFKNNVDVKEFLIKKKFSEAEIDNLFAYFFGGLEEAMTVKSKYEGEFDNMLDKLDKIIKNADS